jgi:hypothetical protein
MPKYFQAQVDISGISNEVQISFDMAADVIESRIAGERVVRVHGVKGKKITGTILCEDDVSALWGTQIASLTITLLDETGGGSDLEIELGKTELNQVSVGAGADDSNPIQMSLSFQSEPAASGSA